VSEEVSRDSLGLKVTCGFVVRYGFMLPYGFVLNAFEVAYACEV